MLENKSSTAPVSRESSCHHERHLNGIALKIYNLLWRLSKKSKGGSIAITNRRIAKLVGARQASEGKKTDYITRCKMALTRDGWLEFLGVSKGTKTGTWAGGRYQAIPHSKWVEGKMTELGQSPCHPPVMTKVSSIHPGGRGLKKKGKKTSTSDTREARTVDTREARTVPVEKRSHRAGEEARTVSVVGSTRTVRARKHAQSVDFSTGLLRNRSRVQQTQGAAPPAPPQHPCSSPPLAGEGGTPSLTHPPQGNKEETTPPPTGGWLEEADERRRSAVRQKALCQEDWARKQKALDQAWEQLGVDPAATNPSFRGVFTSSVYKDPDAPFSRHLDWTVERCRQWKLDVPEVILAAQSRIEAGR